MPDYKERPQWEKQTKTSLAAAWLVLREDAASSLMTGRPIESSSIESRLASSLAYPTVDLWGRVYGTLHQQVTGLSPENPDQIRPSLTHVALIALALSRSIEGDLFAARFSSAEQLALGAELEAAARARAFDILSDARLNSIAITETTRAITAAEMAAAADIRAAAAKAAASGSESGGTISIADLLTLTATWNTERDSRVCPICYPLHGRKLTEIDYPFMSGPPAHPRCRCYLTWITDGKN